MLETGGFKGMRTFEEGEEVFDIMAKRWVRISLVEPLRCWVRDGHLSGMYSRPYSYLRKEEELL